MSLQLSFFDFLFPAPPPLPEAKPQPVADKQEPAPVSKKKTLLSENPFEQYAKVLTDYIPKDSLQDICTLLVKYEVYIKITRKRYTKLGDYRSPHNGSRHRITINHDLNPYSFLVTLVHELAHLTTWEKYKRKAKPHGMEWKSEFRELMLPYIKRKIFPEEVVFALNNYLQNPAASSCTDTHLLKTLRSYDVKPEASPQSLHLEDIPENAIFMLTGNPRLLQKGKKLRKRYLCQEVNSKKKYLVSPVAEVLVKG